MSMLLLRNSMYKVLQGVRAWAGRYNNCPGLRNSNFYPLRTPFPCLAMRHMVPTDIAFMALDK